MIVWSGGPLTPLKYKPIFFVRCKSCRSIPCPAGTKVFDGASNRSPSTCLKTPQNCSKEGRLKPFFANNVDIPFARARRLKPCPRKATVRSGKQTRTYVAVYIDYEGLKATTLLNGMSKRSPSPGPKTYEKSLSINFYLFVPLRFISSSIN